MFIFIHSWLEKISQQILEGVVREAMLRKKQAQDLDLSQSLWPEMAGSASEMALPMERQARQGQIIHFVIGLDVTLLEGLLSGGGERR